MSLNLVSLFFFLGGAFGWFMNVPDVPAYLEGQGVGSPVLPVDDRKYDEIRGSWTTHTYVRSDLNSHYFHIIGDGKNQPNSRGPYIPMK